MIDWAKQAGASHVVPQRCEHTDAGSRFTYCFQGVQMQEIVDSQKTTNTPGYRCREMVHVRFPRCTDAGNRWFPYKQLPRQATAAGN